MARLSKEELNELIKSEGVDRIWSWSKVNKFHTSPFEYYLKYVKKVEEDRKDCIYATNGGLAHDILEKYYTGELKYEDMAEQFKDGWTVAFDIANMKFDRNSEEKNKLISDKYYNNIIHFFEHHNVLNNKPMVEQFAKVKIGNELFQGYIDVCFKDSNGDVHIVDWKTSTIYKGKKAENECGQLIVYALALEQMGIPRDKIKICWNFLKYVNIQYEQANGAVKDRQVERNKIGESLQSNAKMWLKKCGYGEQQVDEYLMKMIDTNGIDCLPDEVKDKYVISDCYVYIDITDKLVDKWVSNILYIIKDIRLRENDYHDMKERGLSEKECAKVFWDTDESLKEQSYYFATLCGYSPRLHLPYKRYLEQFEAQKEGGSFTMGGKNVGQPVSDTDLSWLNDL